MSVHLGVLSLQPAAKPCLLNSGTQFVTHSLSKCQVRCYTHKPVESWRGVRKDSISRSCSSVPTSAAVEQPNLDNIAHESVFFSQVNATIGSKAAEDRAWRSLGRDGRVESLSTSSSNEPVKRGNVGPRGIGTEINPRGSGTEINALQRGGQTADEGTRAVLAKNLDEFTATSREYGCQSRPEVEDTVPGEFLLAEDRTHYFSGEVVRKSSEATTHVPFNGIKQSSRASLSDAAEEPEPSRSQEDVGYLTSRDDLFYVPKVGDQVIGVVASGNEYKLDIDVGSQQLGRMLMKDVYPLDIFSSEELFWEHPEDGAAVPVAPVGQVRVVRDDDDEASSNKETSMPLVEVGSVLSLHVQAITLSGRPLLSARKIANRIAWQRVKQIQQQDEPFEVQLLQWSPDGLTLKIEGLKAFLPKNQLLRFPEASKPLRDLVGEWTYVMLIDVNEAAGKLIVSEKLAWSWRNLRPGSLVHATVTKICSFGLEVNLTGTGLRARIYMSDLSHHYVPEVKELFSVGEKVKALVLKSPVPFRIALSIADLESSRGLILQDKERVFREAEQVVALRQRRYQLAEEKRAKSKFAADIQDDSNNIANWDWLEFAKVEEISAFQ